MSGLKREQGRSLLLLAVLLFGLGLFATTASAQVGTSTPVDFSVEKIPGGDQAIGDFVVGPGKIELEIQPGESKTVMLSVTNRIGEPHTFNFEVEDMVGSSDPARTVELLGSERGPYTLRDYVTLPQTALDLGHNERARIPVTVSIPPDAEPGGRYGSVLVNTVAIEREDGTEGAVTSQSPIIARVGTLFFITIPGDVSREGILKDFTTVPDTSWFTEGPITFGLLFENTGSLHLAPYGTISVTNMFGQEIGYQELDPWFAMPDSLRFREVVWNNDRLFGKYTATVNINRSYQNIVDTATVTFWVVPTKHIAMTFVVFFVVILLLRAFLRRFEFRRRV